MSNCHWDLQMLYSILDIEIPLNCNHASAEQTLSQRKPKTRPSPSDSCHCDTAKRRSSGGLLPPSGLLANNIFPNLVGSKTCTVHVNLHNDGLITEALRGGPPGGPAEPAAERLMNDNNSTDGLTAMRHCAGLDDSK